MTAQGIAQLIVMFVALAVLCPPLGRYMARVYAHDPDGGPAPSPGDRVFLPVERAVYRLLRVARGASSAGTSTRCRCSASRCSASWCPT